MRPGRSVLGVMAGVLLGLGVVVLAGSGPNPYGMRAASSTPALPATSASSMQSATMTNTNGVPLRTLEPNTSFYTAAGQTSSSAAATAPPSQVNSLARQPITLTGFVLLPVFAALLFGFVAYRASRRRNEEDEPPEAA